MYLDLHSAISAKKSAPENKRPYLNIEYNYIMPRHFSNLWNSPKSFNKKDINVEQKIDNIIQKIKFKIWCIFKK